MHQRRAVGAVLGGTLPGKGQGLVDRLARERHAGAQPLAPPRP